MQPLVAHRSATRQFDRRVKAIQPNQWTLSTPDDDWTVRQLVDHLVTEQLWVPDLLAGRTVEEIGDAFEPPEGRDDNLGEDPQAAWGAASAAALAAWNAPGAPERTVHLSFGTVPADVYLWQGILDLVVHAWDLARAIDAADEMPNDLLAEVLDYAKRETPSWSGGDSFKEAIPVPGCTDDLTELLALTGRNRWWRRS